MNSFGFSTSGQTKRQVTEALATAALPETVKALIIATMAGTPDDAIVNVALTGYAGAAGLIVHGLGIHLPPPALKPADLKSAFDLHPQR